MKFIKGQIPWNKGTKGVMRPNKTTFKKGSVIGIKTRFTKDKSLGKNNFKWKGEEVGYYALHSWIIRNYGKANNCESKDCEGKSKIFEWALIKGKKYERKIENFIKLCHKCHKKYDVTYEYRKKMSIIRINYWKNRKK